jgi:hypothetical protein
VTGRLVRLPTAPEQPPPTPAPAIPRYRAPYLPTMTTEEVAALLRIVRRSGIARTTRIGLFRRLVNDTLALFNR